MNRTLPRILVGLLALTFLLPMVSCRRKQLHNPMTVNAVGAPWEVLVVMDKDRWEAPVGRALYEVLDEDVPCLPQSEPFMKISRCNEADFTGILKPVRNIVQVEISPIYSMSKIHISEDVWANNQSVMRIVSPDDESFIRFVGANRDVIHDYFEKAERERNLKYIRRTYNREMSRAVYLRFGYQLMVPQFMDRYKKGEDFLWLSNDKGKKHQSLVIYTFPYTDPNTFTKAYLDAKRDSVMKVNLPGGPAGSYMARQEKEESLFREFSYNGKYAAEIRGLWEVKGDMMGGPYVSLIRLDEQNQKVVCVEIFIYAPDENKRNLLKHNEAALYTLKLPGEFTPAD